MFINEPAFVEKCKRTGLSMPAFNPVREGDVFDLGDRQLEVYELPGHTPGGILLLLPQERLLFTGDGINHHLWLQLEHSLPVEQFVKNIDRLMFLEDKADLIYHGHAKDSDDISLMRCVRNAAVEICEGKNKEDSDYCYFGGKVKQHPFKCLDGKKYQQSDHVIVYNPENIR